jgi:AcrR family transcriptional regulator
MDLFVDRGFEATTVGDIAARAGVTERTFFRHYADKREVLFAGQELFEGVFLDPVREAPEGASPRELLDLVLSGVEVVFDEDRRPWARMRAAVIAANPALQERELLKLTRVSEALAQALTGRGLAPLRAQVVASTAMSVFHTAFGAWVASGETRRLGELQQAALDELRSVAG